MNRQGLYWPHSHTSGGEKEMLEREGESRTGRRVVRAQPVDRRVSAVYFVQAIGFNVVKIGWVQKVDRFDHRLARIETDCPFPVKTLHVEPEATRQHESRAHKHFAAMHHHGEWYRIEGDLKVLLQMCIVDPAVASQRLWAIFEKPVLTL